MKREISATRITLFAALFVVVVAWVAASEARIVVLRIGPEKISHSAGRTPESFCRAMVSEISWSNVPDLRAELLIEAS